MQESSDLRQGITLGFDNICYIVDTHKKQKKQVLHGVSGLCRPGLFAIMGPSGAGKTSLIAILARQIKQNVTGVITLNGVPAKASAVRRHSTYVPQMDVLLATATDVKFGINDLNPILMTPCPHKHEVKEAITTAALLRLPHEMEKADKEEQVRQVIQQLELEGCKDTLVGDELSGIKGISGGERRRLSVALGLVTNPSIIFLDEPTSGLDSETALQLMTCLKKLALSNCTVIASIHQPAAPITAQFDDLLLLAHGRTVYCGAWSHTLDYFSGIDFSCPAYTSIADFLLTIVKDSEDQLLQKWQEHSQHSSTIFSGKGDVEQGETEKIPAFMGEKAILETSGYSGSESALRDATISINFSAKKVPLDLLRKTSSISSIATSFSAKAYASGIRRSLQGWLYTVWIIFVRFARTWLRAPNLMFGLVLQYLFAGTFLGLMYLRLGNTSASSIFDRQAALFLVLIMLGFTPSNSACTIWNAERQLLRRESYSGMYRMSAYFAAKTMITIPCQIFVTTLLCLLVYFLVGFQNAAAKFLIFWTTSILYQLTSENIGLVAAILTKTATTGLILSATIMMILVAFSGFLINHTPVFFRWIPKMSFVTFAYSAVYQNEFDGLKLNVTTNADGSSIYSSGILATIGSVGFRCLPYTEKQGTRGPGNSDFTIAENLVALGMIFLGLRIFTFFLLIAAQKHKQL